MSSQGPYEGKKEARDLEEGMHNGSQRDATAGWGPGPKEYGQPINAGKDKETVLPLSLQKEHSPANSKTDLQSEHDTYVLRHYVCGGLLQQQQGANTLNIQKN